MKTQNISDGKRPEAGFTVAALVAALLLLLAACGERGGPSYPIHPPGGAGGKEPRAAEPTVEASPVEQGEDGWKVAAGDRVSFAVNAPGAEKVSLLYRPVVADEDRHVELRSLDAPSGGEGGKFTAEVSLPPDFAGQVWARATYPDGASKDSGEISLTTRAAGGDADKASADANTNADANANTNKAASSQSEGSSAKAEANGESAQTAAERAADTHESARSDKFTGGRIRKAALRPGRADIRITVNVPAFTMTLWQDGREVKTYPVGVGRKAFPIPSGLRQATQVIFNPAWIPPDSAWVRASSGVEPYERIPADDPRNPLGKIKIPLGSGYLLHEAAAPSDIGNLVSHGCVRVLTDDLFDLAEKIIAARGLQVPDEEISRLRSNTERRAVRLDEPLPVDINYDTLVVEGGRLHVYPDVYERGTNTVERLRAELSEHGADASRLDEQTLGQILERASASEAFVVKLSDIRAGRALRNGRAEPLPGHSGGKETGDAERESSGRAR